MIPAFDSPASALALAEVARPLFRPDDEPALAWFARLVGVPWSTRTKAVLTAVTTTRNTAAGQARWRRSGVRSAGASWAEVESVRSQASQRGWMLVLAAGCAGWVAGRVAG
jgi:hypothetical protein